MASSADYANTTEQRASDSSPPPSPPANQRLLSLDAVRGFTMFWLIGGREFFLGLIECLYSPLFEAFEDQVTHPKWQGFVAWDLVMPVFLFLVGTSMPFAMVKRQERRTSLAATYWRIGRRVATLWILGAVAQWLKYSPGDMDGMELYSNALQAIAMGYLVTALALLHLRLGYQICLFLCLVLGYGALLMFVPFGGHPGGTLQRNANLPLYIDVWLLGDYRRDHAYTWILTSLGFAASVLLGAMAGHLLATRLAAMRKLLWLAVIGVGCMACGWLWSYWLPLNRHLWTSSMILWGGGFSFLLLALFYAVIDVAGVQRWSFPLVVIGANALLAYVIDPISGWTSDYLVKAFFHRCPVSYLNLCSAFIEMLLIWLLLWYLYRRRMFFRA